MALARGSAAAGPFFSLVLFAGGWMDDDGQHGRWDGSSPAYSTPRRLDTPSSRVRTTTRRGVGVDVVRETTGD